VYLKSGAGREYVRSYFDKLQSSSLDHWEGVGFEQFTHLPK
jgi:hypothetical protein